MKTASCVLLYMAVVPCLILAQSEGDVRLASGLKKNIGRLEIVWQGEWSTFCGLSTGGAQAACRQLGYLDFIIYKPLDTVKPDANISQASPDTPIAIDYTECKRSFSDGQLHILRCGYSTDVASDCSHSNDIVLQCQTTSLWQHPYDTQVRLNHTVYPSSGVLEIYIRDGWGNVCGNKFDQVAADSACRQMGYTSASSFSILSPSSTSIAWLDNVACNTSCNCFNGCFDNTPSQPITCGNNHFVNITCTYDINIAKYVQPGSKDVCSNRKTSCNGTAAPTKISDVTSLSTGDIAGIVVGVVLLVVMVISVIVLVAVLCLVLPKRGYTPIN